MTYLEDPPSMGSHGKPSSWFPSLHGHHRRRSSSSSLSQSPSPASSQIQNPSSSAMDSLEFPKEFVCPISGRLMADPVVIITGNSFERNCIQACKDLNVIPPGAGDSSAAEIIIPNINLRSAIFNWCDSRGMDRPQSVDLPTAQLFVRDLPSAPSLRSRSPRNSISDPQISPLSPSISSSSSSSICSDSSSAIVREILTGLKAPQISDQEAALLFLRSSSRGENPEQRSALCDEKILAALRPMIISRYPSLCLHAVAAIVNLSLHQPNRVRIVRAGLIPPLVDSLKSNVPEAQDHAAAAIFSLSVEEDNKAAIGVLGALPPLFHLFCKSQIEERTRKDAGMAIYHLSMASTNVSKLLKLGAMKTLLGFAVDGSHGSSGLSLMILCNLAASREGREAMIEAGAVQTMTEVLRAAPPGKSPETETKKEHCVGVLYAMSKARMRFRGMAQSAGLEEVMREMEMEEDVEREDGMKKRRFREMVRRIARACGGGGEEEDGGSGSWGSGDTGGAADFVGTFSEPILRMHSSSVHAHGAHTTRF